MDEIKLPPREALIVDMTKELLKAYVSCSVVPGPGDAGAAMGEIVRSVSYTMWAYINNGGGKDCKSYPSILRSAFTDIPSREF